MKDLIKIAQILTIILCVGCTSLVVPPPSTTTVIIDQPVVKNLNQVDPFFKTMQKSLVRLHLKNGTSPSIGTGFFYKSKNTIFTNYHVIAEQADCVQNKKCLIYLGFTKNSKQVIEVPSHVTIVLQDKTKDLAILKIENTQNLPTDINPLQTKSSSTDGKLTAVGYYQDDPSLTFSEGKLIQGKNLNQLPLSSIIIGAGFSGSPVINNQGELVGMVTSYKPLRGQSIGLAEFIAAEDI